MKRMYPTEGWDTEWIKLDNQEIHMIFKRCLYLDLTRALGCPELCTVFCKNDTVAFAGYAPRIHFERNGTLAEGHACCDFISRMASETIPLINDLGIVQPKGK